MLWRAHLLLRLHGLNTMELLHTYLHGLLNTRCNSAEVYDEGSKIERGQQQLKAGIYSKVGPNTMSKAHVCDRYKGIEAQGRKDRRQLV